MSRGRIERIPEVVIDEYHIALQTSKVVVHNTAGFSHDPCPDGISHTIGNSGCVLSASARVLQTSVEVSSAGRPREKQQDYRDSIFDLSTGN